MAHTPAPYLDFLSSYFTVLRSWGGINKTSCDNLAIIFKAGTPYLNKVNLKRLLPYISKAPIQTTYHKKFVRSFVNELFSIYKISYKLLTIIIWVGVTFKLISLMYLSKNYLENYSNMFYGHDPFVQKANDQNFDNA